MTSKKLVLVTSVSGTLRFFRGLGKRLHKDGWQAFAVASDDQHLRSVCEQGCFIPHPIAILRRITPLSDICAIVQMVNLFLLIKPQIVHAHTPKAGLTAMCAAWVTGVPVRIYTIHGVPLETAFGIRAIALWLADCVAIALATDVYCVSESVKKAIQSARIPLASKARVLMQGSAFGIDVDGRFSPERADKLALRKAERERLGIPLDAVVVGFVGRLVPDKGLRELRDAWNLLSSKDIDTRLLLVGAADPDGGTDEATLRLISSNERWICTGWVSDVVPYYCVMDFLVLPSYREGLPTTVLEAAALQVPAITTNATGCIDSVVHGYTGLIVPVRDAERLADAMSCYARSPALRRTHGLAAQARVRRLFSEAAVLGCITREYNKGVESMPTYRRSRKSAA